MELMTEKNKGLKKSEVGLIPEDWEIIQLDSITDPHRTIRYGIVQPGDYDESGRYMVRGKDYSFGWVQPKNLFKVSAKVENKYKNARLYKGDVILTIVGANTGTVAIVPDWLDGANITQTTARIPLNSDKVVPNYVYYFLDSKLGQQQVNDYMKGGAQPGLNIGDIRTFQIPLPPTLEEQQAIASALSDVDELIRSLDRLIEKKEAIKKGTMQQLLTGKKRLPGFGGEWEIFKMDSVFQFKQGVQVPVPNQSDIKEEGKVRFIRIVDLTNENEPPRFISNPGLSYQISKNDLFMVRYGSPGLLGFGYEGVIANNLFRLMPKKEISNAFFYYLLGFKNNEILELTSSTTMAALNFSSLSQLTLEFPPDKKDQKAIAQILSDMDRELQTLRKKREKMRRVKEGMMQELLTGRVRLI